MASIKMAILNSLENLSKDDYGKFCMALVDRRGERRVPKSKVEERSRVEVTNVLVSTFTEADAPSVVSELFRVIGCFQEAQELESVGCVVDEAGDLAHHVTERRPVQGAAGPSVNRDQVQKHEIQGRSYESQRSRKTSFVVEETSQELLDAQIVGIRQVIRELLEELCDEKVFRNWLDELDKETAALSLSVLIQGQRIQFFLDVFRTWLDDLNGETSPGCATEWRPVLGAVDPSVDCDQFQGHQSQKTKTHSSALEQLKATQSWLDDLNGEDNHDINDRIAQTGKVLSTMTTHHVTMCQSTMDDAKLSVFSDLPATRFFKILRNPFSH
ncbi:uncharacterized protein LOC144199701 [Stigmatopora nigra]